MKIETFTKTGIICVAVLSAILLIYGNVYWSSIYDIDPSPSFAEVNRSFDHLSVIRSSHENITLLAYSQSGQVEEANADSDDNFILYQARAFEAASSAATTSNNNWFASIERLGAYIKTPPIIIGTIIVFLVVSISFAIAAFWRGYRM